jgi:hypothetical protein
MIACLQVSFALLPGIAERRAQHQLQNKIGSFLPRNDPVGATCYVRPAATLS